MRVMQIMNSSVGIFISDYDEGFCSLDNDIAKSLGIKHKQYRDTLIKKYNGHLAYAGEIYFSNMKDAEKALDWVNSLEMLIKLRGVTQ
jgi:hypothetical protein